MLSTLRRGLVGLALAGAAGCTHVPAAVPAPTPLEIPQPPPRVVVPPSADLVDPPPPPPQSPAPVATPRPASTPPVRPDRPAPPTTAVVTPTVPETAPPPPLETTSDVSALEQQTSALITNARRDLQRVDKSVLSSEARAQYERALGFVKQAENAMKEKNLTYARSMAEKAAALASQLPKTR